MLPLHVTHFLSYAVEKQVVKQTKNKFQGFRPYFAVAQFVEAMRYKPKGPVRCPIVSLDFFFYNPSDRTMGLGLTQPPTEMSRGGGIGGRCVGLTLPHSYAEGLKSWEPQPPGTLRACTGIAVPLPLLCRRL